MLYQVYDVIIQDYDINKLQMEMECVKCQMEFFHILFAGGFHFHKVSGILKDFILILPSNFIRLSTQFI